MFFGYVILDLPQGRFSLFGGDTMPDAADIIRDSINEFSRLQNWMLLVKGKNPDAYNSMYDRYIEL